MYGITSAGWTMAMSSPASTAWYRKTELSTGRECAARPNEMLLMPRMLMHAGQFALDAADALDGLHGRIEQILLSGAQREGLRVEDQRVGGQAVLAAGDLVDAPRHLDLALGRLGHALLVDGHADDGRAVVARLRQHGVELDRARSPC